MQAFLELHFSGAATPQLQKTIFVSLNPAERLVSCRNTLDGAFQRDSFIGQFSWTPAVNAATTLLLRTAAEARSSIRERVVLGGASYSAAAILDRALSKESSWLLDMFGASERGESNAARIFRRINSERQHGGDVNIFVNEEFLPGGRISVFVDEREECSSQAIYELAARIEGERGDQHEGSIRSRVASVSNSKLECSPDSKLVCHRTDVRIDVMNERGDAEVLHEKSVENLEPASVRTVAFDIWLDSSHADVNFHAWDETGRPLSVIAANDHELYKRFKIELRQEIRPFDCARYGYSYFAKRIFADPMNWWSFKIRESTVRLTMQIVDGRYRDLDSFFGIA